MRKFRLLLPLLLLLFNLAKAQDNTPYARYGIGELENQGFAATRGSADLTAAYSNQSGLNFNNPASLGFLRFTTFDIGGDISNSWLKTASGKSTFGSADPNYIALGFPILKNRWSAGFGLSQFSSANYQVIQYNDSTAPLNSNKNTYTGTGGINQLYFATGARFRIMVKDSASRRMSRDSAKLFEWGNFAVGIKAAFLFGNISYTNTLEFVDTSNAYNTRVIESRRVAGILVSGGLQYNINFGKRRVAKNRVYHLSFGLDGNLTSHVAARQNLLYERYTNNVAEIDSPHVYDTIQQVSGQKGSIVIPMQIDGGITFSKDNNYSIGAQFHYGKWSQYNSFGNADSTTDNWKISVGGEWTPTHDPNGLINGSYFSVVNYRFGLYYGTNYLRFENKDFTNYGITFGFGLPIKGSFAKPKGDLQIKGDYITHLNIAFNIGQLGNVNDNGQRQIYFMTTVGFSLSDLWFVKAKYN